MQQKLSPAALVLDAIVATKGTCFDHPINIVQECQDDLPILITDKHKVLQILVNLIKNAIDALRDTQINDPEIRVRASSVGEDILFEVIDNGIGISEDKLNKIFQHGFTTKQTGNGFGLHSAANSATELGGTLMVSSHGIGKGATFQFKLPERRKVIEQKNDGIAVGSPVVGIV